ncbi:Chaperone protein DnaJ [Glutamicibacter creatinolyticus]|uniref:Chaperone protein DnaJ n=1 Tax=Glutamicibacter creatinolyticus TaxID=162496 RepID=A0A5B7WWA4_9MICC|nr:J domain-containing protein [Glutamicibacter creatinolyticus]QCY47605.1 Chaperone protein DnaJ [Glutamicibacter creatinolyticus]
MSSPSPYEVLGIARTASQAEIKMAYRKAARESHPDLGGSAERFRAVQRAYQLLSDEADRSRYDRSFQAPDTRSTGSATSAGTGSRPFDERVRTSTQPKAQMQVQYVPPLEDTGFTDLSAQLSRRQVHGEPRKRGLFTSRSRLEREAATISLLERNVLSVLPAARLINGVHSPGGGHYDHVLLAGYRMAVIGTMTLPEGYYMFDGQVLRHGNRMTQPPVLQISGLQRAFMNLNVVPYTLVLTGRDNPHEPVIEYGRKGAPALAASPNVLNAAGLVRELKLFLGSGPQPNLVDRPTLARLLAGMY